MKKQVTKKYVLKQVCGVIYDTMATDRTKSCLKVSPVPMSILGQEIFFDRTQAELTTRENATLMSTTAAEEVLLFLHRSELFPGYVFDVALVEKPL